MIVYLPPIPQPNALNHYRFYIHFDNMYPIVYSCSQTLLIQPYNIVFITRIFSRAVSISPFYVHPVDLVHSLINVDQALREKNPETGKYNMVNSDTRCDCEYFKYG